ncbi:MAG: 4Fe-4S binding protein [Candidatus Cloacimonetes bacterium]|nr:4Fe-4S binding protein [Candidatus Cloacimonadota bacterium]
MACMRKCITQAIRVRAGKSRIIPERCIDCGECINVCPNNAIIPLTDSFTDFSMFKYSIAIPSPSLFAQFDKDITPDIILAGLKKIGFDDAYDSSFACESVSLAIQVYLDNYHGPKPLISSSCPTIVRLIQVKYPELVDLIIPIEPPREIAAREMKIEKSKELGLKSEEIGAIYITPCPAKALSIKQPAEKEKSQLDGAISITDIYNLLLSAITGLKINTKNAKKSSGIGMDWATLGGVTRSLKAENCLAVTGLPNVIKVLDDIEKGKLRDIEFVECFSCSGGCIGGSLTVENVYVSRSKVIKLVEILGETPQQDMDKIRQLYRKNYFFMEAKLLPRPLKPLDNDISKAIEKMRKKQTIYESLPKIDCGACGSPNCMAFAEDVVRGEVEIDKCIIKLKGKLKESTCDLLREHDEKMEVSVSET